MVKQVAEPLRDFLITAISTLSLEQQGLVLARFVRGGTIRQICSRIGMQPDKYNLITNSYLRAMRDMQQKPKHSLHMAHVEAATLDDEISEVPEYEGFVEELDIFAEQGRYELFVEMLQLAAEDLVQSPASENFQTASTWLRDADGIRNWSTMLDANEDMTATVVAAVLERPAETAQACEAFGASMDAMQEFKEMMGVLTVEKKANTSSFAPNES